MGYVVAANPLGQMLFSPLVGWWGNRRDSVRLPVLITLALFTLTSAAYSAIEVLPGDHKTVMIASRFFVGVSSGNDPPTPTIPPPLYGTLSLTFRNGMKGSWLGIRTWADSAQWNGCASQTQGRSVVSTRFLTFSHLSDLLYNDKYTYAPKCVQPRLRLCTRT
jgi:MFS family permease